jgi:hypothetical protein
LDDGTGTAGGKSIDAFTVSVGEEPVEKPDSDFENLSQDEETYPDCKEELRKCGCLIREILLDG